VYSLDGFIEKNANDVPRDVHELMQRSTNSVLHAFGVSSISKSLDDFDRDNGRNSNRKSVDKRRKRKTKPSVVSQFKIRLGELMSILNKTKPYYIRCIKPMDLTFADGDKASQRQIGFDDARVVEQLQSSGALEAVRISRSGFPVRMTHRMFYRRYR
jgi:myosin V